jgi:hypothetical protein
LGRRSESLQNIVIISQVVLLHASQLFVCNSTVHQGIYNRISWTLPPQSSDTDLIKFSKWSKSVKKALHVKNCKAQSTYLRVFNPDNFTNEPISTHSAPINEDQTENAGCYWCDGVTSPRFVYIDTSATYRGRINSCKDEVPLPSLNVDIASDFLSGCTTHVKDLKDDSVDAVWIRCSTVMIR